MMLQLNFNFKNQDLPIKIVAIHKLCMQTNNKPNHSKIFDLMLQIISAKTLEFAETNSYFIRCTYEKTYLAAQLTSGQIFCEFVDRQKLWIHTKIFSSCWRFKPGFLFFFSLHKIQMSQQHRLIHYTISYQGLSQK